MRINGKNPSRGKPKTNKGSPERTPPRGVYFFPGAAATLPCWTRIILKRMVISLAVNAFFFGIILFIALGFFVLHIAVAVWIYRDAIQYGRTQEFALILLVAALMFPVMGPVVYWIIRKQ